MDEVARPSTISWQLELTSNCGAQKNHLKPAEFEEWLPGMDSNHDSRLQRPLSYH